MDGCGPRVINEDDTKQVLADVAAMHARIQQLHVNLAIISSKIPEPSLNSTLNTSHSTPAYQMKLPKLPAINIPEFSGKDGEWGRFKEVFLSVIDARTDLDDFKKMEYLKGYCVNEAALTIAGITITAVNYKVAWEKLKEQYENLPLIISRLTISLINLPSMNALTAFEMFQIVHHATIHDGFLGKNIHVMIDIGELNVQNYADIYSRGAISQWLSLVDPQTFCGALHTQLGSGSVHTADSPDVNETAAFGCASC